MHARPAFLITIDTEGDNLWRRPRDITTENRRYLPRFQALCERYGFKPTYLTDYEMAMDGAYVEWARHQQAAGRAEVGMHLHAWNSPPLVPLTDDDFHYQPYLIEYKAALMREKIIVMTDLLAERFGQRPTSHRAGRWGFNVHYARILRELGYLVDCSVVPGVNFAGQLGDPKGDGGPDFRGFPDGAYHLDQADIRKRGSSPLLELPVTALRKRPVAGLLPPLPGIAGRVARKLEGLVLLRPNGRNLDDLLWLVGEAARQERPYIEFMLHSSELMPGGSPVTPDPDSVETLYAHMDHLFARAAEKFAGETLTGYYRRTAAQA